MTLDDGLKEAMRRDWRTAELDDRERTMLAYVELLTLRPARVQREDLDPLRAAGFDDVAILQVNLIASFYVEVVRGIPLLVQLFYIYFALGRLVKVPDIAAAVAWAASHW